MPTVSADADSSRCQRSRVASDPPLQGRAAHVASTADVGVSGFGRCGGRQIGGEVAPTRSTRSERDGCVARRPGSSGPAWQRAGELARADHGANADTSRAGRSRTTTRDPRCTRTRGRTSRLRGGGRPSRYRVPFRSVALRSSTGPPRSATRPRRGRRGGPGPPTPVRGPNWYGLTQVRRRDEPVRRGLGGAGCRDGVVAAHLVRQRWEGGERAGSVASVTACV